MSIFGNNANKPQGSIFGGNTNQQQGNIFGGNQQQQGNIFSGNQQQQQGSNTFNNQQQGQQGNIFNNNQQQQGTGNIFGGNQSGNQQQRANIFGSNQQNTGQQQTGNIFGGQQQQGNIFGANQQQQQQGGNVFNNQQQQPQQQNSIFGGQQQQPQQQNSIFGGQQQQPQQQNNSIFGNQQQQQQGNLFGNQQQQTNIQLSQMTWQQSGNEMDRIKSQVQQCCRRIDPRNLEQMKLDEMNMFKDVKIGELANQSQQIKNSLIILVGNMKTLRNAIDKIKLQNEDLDKKSALYCKSVQQKLIKYKQVLIQNIQQTNMLEEVKQQVELIQNQVNSFIIPLFNAYRSGKHHSFDSPDEFSSTIAKNILQKMIQLNNKVDEIISCQQNQENDSISQQDSATLIVLQQLLNYYQNVSAKVLQFTTKYNIVKKDQLIKNSRTHSYQDVIRRIQDKVKNKMTKDFKCYDLIKEIQDILQKREKREKDLINSYDKSLEKKEIYGSSYSSSSWNKY